MSWQLGKACNGAWQQLDHLLVRYLPGCANDHLLLRKRELLIGAAPTAAILHAILAL